MPNIGNFNGKIFNPQVFEKYRQRIPNLKMNELIKSGVFQNVNKYKNMMTNQDGGYYIIEPIKGLLDGEVQNYDGVEDMTPTSTKTYYQGKVVFGRMKAWQEKDFAMELTGVNWIKDIAGEVAEFYQSVDEDDFLAILQGIFAMSTTDAGNADFVNNHTYEVSGKIDETTSNNAIQKAMGANGNAIQMAVMNSQVATNLKNLSLLSFVKQVDANGLQREIGLATWNGRTVIIDDTIPTIEVGATYAKTTDTTLNSSKTYYTKTGSGANATYTAVTNPNVANIGDYYEMTKAGTTKYQTFLLGRGAFEYEDIGAKVPSETGRDPKTNGGIDLLYTRQRKLMSPKWISYTKASQATSSPTKTELATGSNWELVNDGQTTGRTYANHKAIPIIKIVSEG